MAAASAIACDMSSLPHSIADDKPPLIFGLLFLDGAAVHMRMGKIGREWLAA